MDLPVSTRVFWLVSFAFASRVDISDTAASSKMGRQVRVIYASLGLYIDPRNRIRKII
jgi:hypothetical protein